MNPAQRARELFYLAEPMSSVLRAIEVGTFDDPANAAALFDDTTVVGREMRAIVNHWQSATGERLKERPTGTVVGAPRQPLRVPTPGSDTDLAASRPARATAPPVAAAAANGTRG
jgi:hypothetical protein